jgi:hypothetical protein
MSEHRILWRIGLKLRNQSRDIVEARLPDQLSRLVQTLELLEARECKDAGSPRLVAEQRPRRERQLAEPA